MDSPIRIINDIEVSCSYTVYNIFEQKTLTGTVQPNNSQVVASPFIWSKVKLTVVRGTTTYTYNDGSMMQTYTLSVIFGPRQYKQTDTASTTLSEDNLRLYVAAGGKPDDTIARVREYALEKARLGEEAK
ncbi:hypothetical protein APHAL10511_002964 [Amanita phalloides]|nr:hypothetical protein APHAL10511_002964 [Amanita phalloides]